MNRAFTVIEVVVAIAIVLIVIGAVLGALSGKVYTSNGTAIKVVDGCEYLVSGSYEHEMMTHKSNCTNRLHSWNQ